MDLIVENTAINCLNSSSSSSTDESRYVNSSHEASSSALSPSTAEPNSAYRVNDNSHHPEDSADANATILSEAIDFHKRIMDSKDRATWCELLKKQKERAQEGKDIDSFTLEDVKTTEIFERTRADGFSYLLLPFKQDPFLMDNYVNVAGRLRFGNLFQDCDSLAGRVAARHCKPAEPMNVTASIDRIYVTRKIDEIHKYNFVIVGYVTYTGRSSMEICIKGFSFEHDIPSEITPDFVEQYKNDCFLSANFTFVARNPATHKSHAVNKLLPATEKEWVDFKRAESRIAAKKLRAKLESLENVPPTEQESKMIHNLYTSSKKFAQQGKPSNIVFMKDTRLSSTQIQQPQYRNRHGVIFGGYLLRQTFELAYCAAGAFSKSNARFISLDNTTFKVPVPVGSVLYMDAEVCYTEHIHEKDESSESAKRMMQVLKDYDTSANELSSDEQEYFFVPGTLIQVKVETKIRNLGDSKMTESGTFVYSFYVPRDGNGEFDDPGYCSVIPETYGEMMDYVEGRRRTYDTAAYAQQLKLSRRA
ncbi:hypothetical protein KL905_000680 [Ogataea polymorpha]|nr:hypothetical protein KL908_002404 [Ogataea polymorpha]KAG7902081.1 hypothetical protein KL935_002041 [Ogataea polymorpha]KAG7910598.1 hypothetical protein KL907_001489 [Ogataea polymorpha]KAG7911116.1 hypothetical protein KL906_001496 [Ogataea polymorpha]KAG7918339.1 hypothetical protein KL927_001796 [Ogataea polymorpha]